MREAIARLYDVDEDTVVFKKLQKTRKYDQGTVTFNTRPGALIDLNKMHESLWATRLSGGTRSGLVSLDITAVGSITQSGNELRLRVNDSDAEFVLLRGGDSKTAQVFDRLKRLNGKGRLKVTGRVDNYQGRWPNVLKGKPKGPRRIIVISFEELRGQVGG